MSTPRRFLHAALLRQLLWLLAVPVTISAQSNIGPRITQQVDESILTTLTGNTHTLARPQFDQGAAPTDLPLERMLLVLKRGPEQEAALKTLLDEQQDKNSSNYHRWLAPEQFGQLFGAADPDIQTVTSWLRSHGFQIDGVTAGRSVIEFSGTSGQVQEAFRTEIHKYLVNGEEHWANSTDPQIPAALAPVIAGVASLHNFPRKPLYHLAGVFSKSKADGKVHRLGPEFTFPYQNAELYAVGPYDFAKIYNVLPLWGSGIDGTGQSIAIVGESNINIQDVRDFRTLFNLPSNDPQIILDGPDPGIVTGDETESDLDVQWSGAIAKAGTIKLVVSASTNSSAGVDLSALYAVNNNLASILSESYIGCELFLGAAGNQFYSNLWEQAAAQGITVVIASGDSGAAGCDGYQGTTPEPAKNGLMVSGIASTPFDVAVGGTDFQNFGPTWNVLAPGTSSYWNLNNDSNQASVNSYIPETSWNDSCANPAFDYAYESTGEMNCNDSRLMNTVWTIAGGGGTSNCTTSDGVQPLSCSGGYPKPAWQTGTGVPNDNARDLPDVSLFASNGFTNSFYIVCESDQDPNGVSCNLSLSSLDFLGLGGTSASAPAFAALMALTNQYTSSTGQGNANYVLYKIPELASQKGLNCNSTSPPDPACAINDITSGTIAMPCATNTLNCTTSSVGDRYGVLSGYGAAPGYDLATGLGSLNAYNLVHSWGSVSFISTQTSLHVNGDQPANIVHGQPLPFVAAVTSNSGTPTGQVSLFANTSTAQPAGVFSLNNGSISASTSQLAGGSYTLTAHYLGDGAFGGSTSSPSVSVTVQPESSATSVSVLTADNNGNPVPFSSGPYGSFVYLRADVTSAQSSQNIYASPPTGAITFADDYNGSATNVRGDPYSLNSSGYTVTPRGVLDFAAGSHSISASYTGDNSYLKSDSKASVAFTITPVSTWTDFLYSISPSNTAPLGTPITIDATVYSTSKGDGPTGTITFFEGGTQLGNPVPVVGTVDPLTQNAEATASFPVPSLQDGPNQITGNYSGDNNYLASNGFGVLYELISTTTTVSTSSSSVAQGTPLTVTAHVTANQPGGPPINTSVDFAEKSDSSPYGYYIAQNVPLTNGVAQFTTNDMPADFLLTGNLTITAYYGNNNYYSSSSGGTTETVLIGPGVDFTISANTPSTTVSAPGALSNPLTLTVTGQNGFNSTINFTAASCSIFPAGSLSSCSFSPTSILGSGSTQVTIQTSAPHTSVLLGAPPRIHAERILNLAAAVCVMIVLALMGALPAPTMPRRWDVIACVLLLACLVLSQGCGGASGGGGGGSSGGPGLVGGTPVGVPFTVTVTASTGQLTHTAAFTFVVQ